MQAGEYDYLGSLCPLLVKCALLLDAVSISGSLSAPRSICCLQSFHLHADVVSFWQLRLLLLVFRPLREQMFRHRVCNKHQGRHCNAMLYDFCV